jgi:hypothetical protein
VFAKDICNREALTMKKAVKQTSRAKTSAAKKPGKPATKQAPAPAIVGQVQNGMVNKQPQVKEQAAVAHAMFLYTDDAWAQRYFDQNDLHFLEREVFG